MMNERELQHLQSGLNGKNVEPRKIRRQRERETKTFQSYLLNLINGFLQYRDRESNLKLQELELDKRNREWKQFVKKWNANPERYLKLRETDFLNLLNNQLLKIERDAKKK